MKIHAVWIHVVDYLEAGGFIMPPLMAALFLLWFAIGYRWLLLRRGTREPVEKLWRRVRRGEPLAGSGILIDAGRQLGEWAAKGSIQRQRVDRLFQALKSRLTRFSVLANTLVVTAPLMGLLGTVSGMIETFDSLADMALFSQTGGIAGGISTALFTTQMGLAVAIPGYFLLAALKRRQKLLEGDLLRLQDLIHGTLNSDDIPHA